MKMDQWVVIDIWCIDEDGSMICHWYMLHTWRWIDVLSLMVWCIHVLIVGSCDHAWNQWQRDNVIVIYRCKDDSFYYLDRKYKWINSKVVPLWWNPSWEDALWMSYPRSMVREPILNCGIIRWRSVNLLVKLSSMDSVCHAISGGMWNVT